MAAANRAFHVQAAKLGSIIKRGLGSTAKTAAPGTVKAHREGIGAGRIRWINRPKRFDAFGHGGSHKAKRP